MSNTLATNEQGHNAVKHFCSNKSFLCQLNLMSKSSGESDHHQIFCILPDLKKRVDF